MSQHKYIVVNEIPPDGLKLDARLELTGDALAADAIDVRAARLHGEAVPGERGVELRARIEARVRLTCDRCLEPFESEIRGGFFLLLVPEAVECGAGDSAVGEDDAALFTVPDGRADLAAIGVEQVYLNLPLRRLCDVDCAGLCPTCGADRNRLKCGCRSEDVDPRLAPLLDLKRRTEDR